MFINIFTCIINVLLLQRLIDDGLVVPSITSELRWKLFNLVEENGLTSGRQNEIIGRAATEMVLQLLGGGYR